MAVRNTQREARSQRRSRIQALRVERDQVLGEQTRRFQEERRQIMAVYEARIDRVRGR